MRLARLFVSVPLCAMLWETPLLANSVGICGYSGYTGSACNPGSNSICNVCHTGGQAPTVSLTGPATLAPSATGTFVFTVESANPAVQKQAGIDIAANGGTLQTVSNQDEKIYPPGGSEITHNGVPKANDANGVTMWTFKWKAPAIAGTYTLFAAGNSVNRDFNNTGDRAAATTLSVQVGNATPLPTSTASATNSPLPSPTPTLSPTPPPPSPTRSPTHTPVDTATPTLTAVDTPTPTFTASDTPTPTFTASEPPTPTFTSDVSDTPTATASPSPTPTTVAGDANCDRVVTAADLPSVVFLAGNGDAPTCGADVNADGIVDADDVAGTVPAIFEP